MFYGNVKRSIGNFQFTLVMRNIMDIVQHGEYNLSGVAISEMGLPSHNPHTPVHWRAQTTSVHMTKSPTVQAQQSVPHKTTKSWHSNTTVQNINMVTYNLITVNTNQHFKDQSPF